MTTVAQVQEAHRMAPKHRFAMRDRLRVNEEGISATEQELVAKVRAVTTAEAYDKAMADKNVNALFCRGVLTFRES